MKKYAVALYFTNHSGSSQRLYQIVVDAANEYEALGMAYREAKKKLVEFTLELEIVTLVKGGEEK